MSDRRALLARLAPAILVLALALAIALRVDDPFSLPSSDQLAARALTAQLDALPDDAVVIVGFDPDIGTYAEIRPTVRALLADLLNRGAMLAVVSLTPDGRALALAERARMGRAEANPRQLIDLGFIPGAEAALVALSHQFEGDAADPISTDLPARVDLAEADLAVVIGGIDLSPRSWVEQVAPRTEGLPLVAIAPTVLLPELEPYRESGQLAALVATARDGAAYREGLDLGPLARLVEPSPGPSPAALVLGLLVAIVALGASLASHLGGVVRASRPRETA
jgi:hypothetical protein